MHISIALYGAARVVVGQPLVDLSFDIPAITLGQVLEKMIATYPRARPYLLDESGSLPSYMRVLINNIRPNPDATLATLLRDKDHVSLLVAVAGGARPNPFHVRSIAPSSPHPRVPARGPSSSPGCGSPTMDE
nr:hypothetical protein [Ktedonobacteraceae bacterium]